MKINIRAYYHQDVGKIYEASRVFEMPAVPRTNEWLDLDIINESYRVTEVHYNVDGRIDVVVRVDSVSMEGLLTAGWTPA